MLEDKAIMMEKNLILYELKEEVQDLKKEVIEKERMIEELQEQLHKQRNEAVKYMKWYDEINNSRIWKISFPIRKILDFIKSKGNKK